MAGGAASASKSSPLPKRQEAASSLRSSSLALLDAGNGAARLNSPPMSQGPGFPLDILFVSKTPHRQIAGLFCCAHHGVLGHVQQF
jgi:hypothetical protein